MVIWLIFSFSPLPYPLFQPPTHPVRIMITTVLAPYSFPSLHPHPSHPAPRALWPLVSVYIFSWQAVKLLLILIEILQKTHAYHQQESRRDRFFTTACACAITHPHGKTTHIQSMFNFLQSNHPQTRHQQPVTLNPSSWKGSLKLNPHASVSISVSISMKNSSGF